MFDSISSIGWAFGSVLLFLGGAVGVGVLVRFARERRYQRVSDES